jgi:Meckel syndrome type 1 protein
MRITLDMQGKMVGQPEMISPTGAAAADPRFKQAGAIAARALQRAAPYDLPPGKFARWRTIEVTFNPGLGVSM